MTRSLKIFALTTLIGFSSCMFAGELLVNFGGGNDKKKDQYQTTTTYGIEYTFYGFRRSERQYISFGFGYTRAETDTAENNEVDVFSFYPQITLLGKARRWGRPFFFTRFLGRSYLSDNTLGYKNQENHFSFQAHLGLGAYIKTKNKKRDLVVMLSYKHFSNAEIFEENDGWNFPFVLTVGLKFDPIR